MAKITAGLLAGVISGKVGNVVFARGPYGPYIRSRVIPVLVQSDYTTGARGRLITLSRAYGQLDPEQKVAWATWSKLNPIVDRLGAVRVLQPSAAFIGINARILQAGGVQRDDPPLEMAPIAATGLSLVAGEAGQICYFEVATGGTGTAELLAVWFALADVGKGGYYRNRRKLVSIVAATPGFPQDIAAEVVARFGAFVAGQVMNIEIEVWDGATGLVSSRVVTSTVVVA